MWKLSGNLGGEEIRSQGTGGFDQSTKREAAGASQCDQPPRSDVENTRKPPEPRRVPPAPGVEKPGQGRREIVVTAVKNNAKNRAGNPALPGPACHGVTLHVDRGLGPAEVPGALVFRAQNARGPDQGSDPGLGPSEAEPRGQSLAPARVGLHDLAARGVHHTLGENQASGGEAGVKGTTVTKGKKSTASLPEKTVGRHGRPLRPHARDPDEDGGRGRHVPIRPGAMDPERPRLVDKRTDNTEAGRNARARAQDLSGDTRFATPSLPPVASRARRRRYVASAQRGK